MKTITACLAAAGLALATATPGAAGPAPAADPGPHATAVGLRFVTLPLVTRTVRLAERLPQGARRPRFHESLAGLRRLKREYDRRTPHQRAKSYCRWAQAIFGYPRRYFYDGTYVWSYPYDACEEYSG